MQCMEVMCPNQDLTRLTQLLGLQIQKIETTKDWKCCIVLPLSTISGRK